MNFKHFVKHAETAIAKNSPTILIGAGVAGCLTTAYLSWKAGRVHERIVVNDPQIRTRREEFDATWKIYIVPTATGVLSIGAIVMSHRIGSRRAAAMAAAYTVMTTDFDDYRKKIVEKMGEKKEKQARDEVVAEKLLQNPPPAHIVIQDGKTWFCDLSTMHYFMSDRQFVEKARNDFNYKLLEEGYADLNEFYAFLNLPSTNVGGQLGWRAGDTQKNTVELAFSAVLMPDGGAATAFQLVPAPKPDFDSFH